MENLRQIKSLLDADKVHEAISGLLAYTAAHPADDNGFFLLGNAYRKLSDWRQAMNSYCRAIEINPSSPAALAYKSIQQILDFYCHDIYNP